MLGESKNIVLVELPGLLRECMRALLSEITSANVVCVGDEIDTTMGVVATLLPALLLVSTSIWRITSSELIRRMKREYPNAVVLALIRGKDGDLVQESVRAGADGYILNEIAPQAFGTAIRNALQHKCYTAPNNTGAVLASDLEALKKRRPALAPNQLSPREREVIVLVASGWSNKAIAKHLGLSVNTVEKHRSNLRRKLGTHNAASMTAHALNQGWLTPSRADEIAKEGAAETRYSASQMYA